MAFSPTQSIPTLAQVLAAGSSAGGATITDLGATGALTIGSTTNGPGMQFSDGTNLTVSTGNLSCNTGIECQNLVVEGSSISMSAMPLSAGSSGTLWNNSNVVQIAP